MEQFFSGWVRLDRPSARKTLEKNAWEEAGHFGSPIKGTMKKELDNSWHVGVAGLRIPFVNNKLYKNLMVTSALNYFPSRCVSIDSTLVEVCLHTHPPDIHNDNKRALPRAYYTN